MDYENRTKTKIYYQWDEYPGLARNSSIGHHRVKGIKYDFRNDMTAYLMDLKNVSEFEVPRTIKHNLKNYAVTAITDGNPYDFFHNLIDQLSFDPLSCVKHICTIDLRCVNTIILPESVESIGYCVFSKNFHLRTIKLINGSGSSITENKYFRTIDNRMLIQKNNSLLLLARVMDTKSIELPCDIETILPYACAQLEAHVVTFSVGSKLKCIDIRAFNKSKITSISIPSSCEIIENEAFNECKYLTELIIKPDSCIKMIGYRAFKETRINNIDFPKKN